MGGKLDHMMSPDVGYTHLSCIQQVFRGEANVVDSISTGEHPVMEVSLRCHHCLQIERGSSDDLTRGQEKTTQR